MQLRVFLIHQIFHLIRLMYFRMIFLCRYIYLLMFLRVIHKIKPKKIGIKDLKYD